MKYRPKAEELAILTALLIERYSKESNKELSRFRLSRKSLKRLAIRGRLRDALLDDFVDIMDSDYGWLVMEHDEELLFYKAEAAAKWTRIATKRCDDLIMRLRQGDELAINDAEEEINRIIDSELLDEEED